MRTFSRILNLVPVMLVAKDIIQVRKQIMQWREQSQSIAFVPTMGALHEGHFKLFERARDVADKVAVSIFVNPIQFDRTEDFEVYPRDEAQDLESLRHFKVELAFIPTAKEMHGDDLPSGVRVIAGNLANDLCGAFRPKHFDGVATIVAKLLNIFQPNVILLGQKDYQQLCIVKELVRNLSFNVEVISVETVRAADGLALSSRNTYLSEHERTQAPALYRGLKQIADHIEQGRDDFENLKDEADVLMKASGLKPEYIEIRCAHSLRVLRQRQFPLVILAAAWLGKARLIDNILMTGKAAVK